MNQATSDPRTSEPQGPFPDSGAAAELAPTYVFLASSDSTYITGETIAVTGGNVFT